MRRLWYTDVNRVQEFWSDVQLIRAVRESNLMSDTTLVRVQNTMKDISLKHEVYRACQILCHLQKAWTSLKPVEIEQRTCWQVFPTKTRLPKSSPPFLDISSMFRKDDRTKYARQTLYTTHGLFFLAYFVIKSKTVWREEIRFILKTIVTVAAAHW